MELTGARISLESVELKRPRGLREPSGSAKAHVNLQYSLGKGFEAAYNEESGVARLAFRLQTLVRASEESDLFRLQVVHFIVCDFKLKEWFADPIRDLVPLVREAVPATAPWIQLRHNRDVFALLSAAGLELGPDGLIDLAQHMKTLGDSIEIESGGESSE